MKHANHYLYIPVHRKEKLNHRDNSALLLGIKTPHHSIIIVAKALEIAFPEHSNGVLRKRTTVLGSLDIFRLVDMAFTNELVQVIHQAVNPLL